MHRVYESILLRPVRKARVDALKKFTLQRTDVTRMRFSAGTAAIRDGYSIATVAGPNARWNCSIILFDPRHSVPILS